VGAGLLAASEHVSEAMALARRPAFIDNRNRTRSRDAERVVSKNPSIARSWVGLTIFACFPCLVAPQEPRSPHSYANSA